MGCGCEECGEIGMAVGRVAMRVLLQCGCYLTGDFLCIQL